jgi:hypothetical protein
VKLDAARDRDCFFFQWKVIVVVDPLSGFVTIGRNSRKSELSFKGISLNNTHWTSAIIVYR